MTLLLVRCAVHLGQQGDPEPAQPPTAPPHAEQCAALRPLLRCPGPALGGTCHQALPLLPQWYATSQAVVSHTVLQSSVTLYAPLHDNSYTLSQSCTDVETIQGVA